MRTTTLMPRRFLLVSLIAAILVPAVYFIVINFWLISSTETIPSNYKKFLIANSTGPRIIIDSGSNSYYGIDAYALSSSLGRTVINMADNAGYSFDHKVNYLIKHAKSGDIILLPLEWWIYTTASLHENYVSGIIYGNLNHYTDPLSFQERLTFILKHVPANTFLDALIKRIGEPRTVSWQLRKLSEYKERILMLEAYSLGGKLVDNNHTKQQLNCDSYLFLQQNNHGFNLSETFISALNKLKNAQNKGARVIFAWPVVVDYDTKDRCYESDLAKSNLSDFSSKIRTHLSAEGFEIIGNPEDTHYPSEYYNDTYYHLTRKGAFLHTEKLTKMLKAASVAPINDGLSIDAKLHLLADEIDRMRTRIVVD